MRHVLLIAGFALAIGCWTGPGESASAERPNGEPTLVAFDRCDADSVQDIHSPCRRFDARRIYRIDGIECDKDEACRAAAVDALARGRIDQAVRIWRDVHGVSWI